MAKKVIPTHDPSEEVFNNFDDKQPKEDKKIKEEKLAKEKKAKEIVLQAEQAEVQVANVKAAEVKLKYRYYCEFCSNTGFFGEYKAEGLVKRCQSCNKTIYTKIANYLPNN